MCCLSVCEILLLMELAIRKYCFIFYMCTRELGIESKQFDLNANSIFTKLILHVLAEVWVLKIIPNFWSSCSGFTAVFHLHMFSNITVAPTVNAKYQQTFCGYMFIISFLEKLKCSRQFTRHWLLFTLHLLLLKEYTTK